MKRIVKKLAFSAILLFATYALADSLDDLARDFWNWRSIEQLIR